MHRFTRPYSHTVDSITSSGPGQLQETENGGLEMVMPMKQKTQEEQDKEDDQARRKALKDLVQSWQDRLQLITLITTFLASVEASMLQVTLPDDSDPNSSSGWSKAANAGFMASLVLHLWASFVSFFASFFLVRFKVQEAKREERQAEAGHPNSTPHVPTSLEKSAHNLTHSPESASPKSMSHPRNSSEVENGYDTLTSEKTRRRRNPSPGPAPALWSANPQLVQCGPFQRQPPVNLLSRCHTLCLVATALGFILAMVGVLCYAWSAQARSVAIITTASIGLCLLSIVFIVLPQSEMPKQRFFLYD
ncbi:hypothetical protein D9757_000479 [Collybiopsis confluens]|uniref:Transmembrane protein n=1 Tax=Collybiopsis confluens TaxID=2823264 RepID=A0A8H5I1N6_9AGAR|nr:hypothetical protein D9757_000479 [Collybiopsis confluens]